MNLPKTAYVLLWFPLPSETFVFREVQNLRRHGLPIRVYSLYGPARKRLSPEMRREDGNVARLGAKSLPTLPGHILAWRHRNPKETAAILREIPFRRWSCLEVAAENLWAVTAGFKLASMIHRDGIEHIHAPWANGPATAAWVASRLTGLPFSFSGRAGDIYPPDGALAEKMRAARFIHTNNKHNVAHLAQAAPDVAERIHQIYNSLTLTDRETASVHMEKPFRLLAIGRFCRTKGFDVLLSACAILQKEGFPFQLTLVGDGLPVPAYKIRRLVTKFDLAARVCLTGFVSHDRVTELLMASDILVMPSVIHKTGDRDGIPNVIMEALSHRLPVIATDVCGIPEVVEDGVTGRLVPQRDPTALARAIKAMAADRAAALRMAEAGHDRVMSLFDPEGNTAALLDLFRTMAGPDPADNQEAWSA